MILLDTINYGWDFGKVLLSSFLVYCVFLIQKDYERYIGKRKQIITLQLYSDLSMNFIGVSRRNAHKLTEFIRLLKNDPLSITSFMTSYRFADIEMIKHTNKEEVYNGYLNLFGKTNEAVKIYRDSFTAIFYIEQVFEKTYEKLNENSKYYKEKKSIYETKFVNLLNVITVIIAGRKDKTIQSVIDDHLKIVLQQYKEGVAEHLQGKKVIPLSFHHNIVVKPISETLTIFPDPSQYVELRKLIDELMELRSDIAYDCRILIRTIEPNSKKIVNTCDKYYPVMMNTQMALLETTYFYAYTKHSAMMFWNWVQMRKDLDDNIAAKPVEQIKNETNDTTR
jgi:hypothetical protein